MAETPKGLDKEAADFFKKEDEKTVDALHAALKINQTIDQILSYIETGFLTQDMPLMQALEKLEKKKFELLGVDPEEAEDAEDEPPST